MKNILITGGSKGLGKEIAKQFKEASNNVIILASSDEVFNTAKELNVTAYKCNIRDERQVKNVIKDILNKYGHIDILINNAGVGYFSLMEETSTEDFDKMFDINVRGTFLVTKELIPSMKQRKSGAIINVSSDVGLRTIPNGSIYAATKYAIQGLSGSLAQELREFGIKVTTINPGMMDTNFADTKQGEDYKKDFIKVEDISDVILYISNMPSYLVMDQIIIHPMSQDYSVN